MNRCTSLLAVYAAAVTVGIVPAGALAKCWNPLGCDPADYDECVSVASTRPTELGVKLAKQQCHEKFLAPAERTAYAASQEKAKRLAATWKKLNEQQIHSLQELLSSMGTPSTVIGPRPCLAVNGGRPAKGIDCIAYYWRDDRGSTFGDDFFQVEALNIPSHDLWMWWTDSLSMTPSDARKSNDKTPLTMDEFFSNRRGARPVQAPGTIK